jgi:hypothetical protein
MLMMHKYVVLFIIIIVVGFVGISRIWQPGVKYSVDKASPGGAYRVKIELREEKSTGTRDRNERLKITYFKRGEVIDAGEWVNSDQYEPSLRNGIEVVEWIGENVLRIGRDRSDQPFDDELIVSNDSDESLQYLEVDYGRYQSFHVFDFAPRSQTRLRASPEFRPDHSSNYFLGFGCKTKTGKEFHGNMEGKKRTSAADGPLKFKITINATDFR